jgi:hypothetical protein
MTKEDVLAAATRQEPPRFRKRAMLALEPSQRLITVVAWVDVEHDDAADSARCDAEVQL